jgi:restriction endonuclease S subunit
MTAMNYKLMNAVRFKSVYNWRFNDSEKYNNFFKIDTVLFNEVINKTSIIKEKIIDEKEYPIIGVRAYGNGAFINRIEKGENLKMRVYQVCQNNHLIWCKVDTKNGAFGIVTDDLEGSYASSNMSLAKINLNKINLDYLQLLFRIPKYNAYMDKAVTGSTNRKYLTFEQILNSIEIPLPKPEIQNQLVNQYNQKLTQAQEAETQANGLEKSIESYLLNELGIEKPKTVEKKQGLQFVRLKELSRWDYLYLTNDFELNHQYPQQSLSYFIDKFLLNQNGTSLRFESYKQPKEEFSYLGMENIEKETGQIVEMSKVKGDEIKSQTVRVPKNYFMYGKLRPYLNKYWYNDTDNDSIICSSEFFVFSIKDNFNRLYFQYVLSSSIIQKQIESITSGVRMPRINESFFKDLQIPLPPKEIQNQIVAHITTQKEKIKALRQQAEALRKQAKEEFENEIFI